ncbi:MAG TPA: serine hydrolase domain-containing protein [Polyangiaceae bacterium]|nr:serine hydrolase domain-containing protein [Polyangiaceae bacterium]
MSTNRRLSDMLASHVERGEVPGLVCLVSRGREVEAHAIGVRTAGTADPMRRDTIFRITSMTKPVTAAAALILVEEGKLRLDDPVDRLLPEIAQRRVLRRIDSALDDTLPAERAITLRDLLTFRMGFGIVWGPPNATPIQRAAEELKLGAFGPPQPQVPPPPDEWMRRFGTLPLMHQPGERWMYNTGAEVLGVLIARAAEQPLDRFFQERIFDPLGMGDTGFWVPASKLDRLATGYFATNPFDPDVGGFALDDPVRGQWSKPPAFFSGGAGLVSTVDDYLAFARMLRSSGESPAGRVLSEDSVRRMTSDQLTLAEKARSDVQPPGYWNGHGWGFGLAVATAPRVAGSPPGYGWDGGFGTYWASDPGADIVAILMTQRAAFPAMAGLYRDFWDTVWAERGPG